MTNKEKMLRMVLENSELQKKYHYDESDYDGFRTALSSDSVIVGTVAHIIYYLDEDADESRRKEVYKSIMSYLNQNVI